MPINPLILSRLEDYQCKTAQEREMALKEITQELILQSLSRSGFFGNAAFQGGTCLRIVHGLRRFSEDLDFVLKAPNPSFALERELNAIKEDLRPYGYDIKVTNGSSAEAAVRAAFVKDDSLTKILSVRNTGGHYSTLKIKIEVDANPPAGSGFETRTILWPFAFQILTQDVASLFSGKIHALLCRPYTKGRDVFDLMWYLGKRMAPNLPLLEQALQQLGPWSRQGLKINQAWVMTQLISKIRSLDFKAVRADLKPFLREQDNHTLQSLDSDSVISVIEQSHLNALKNH